MAYLKVADDLDGRVVVEFCLEHGYEQSNCIISGWWKRHGPSRISPQHAKLVIRAGDLIAPLCHHQLNSCEAIHDCPPVWNRSGTPGACDL